MRDIAGPGFVTPPVPRDELERLQRIAQLGLRPGQRHEPLDVLMQAVGAALGVPIALVSIVDSDEQFFIGDHGLGVDRTPRSVSFCGHCVASRATLRVPDALSDARFAGNPLVLEPPDIRAYLGIPIFGGLGQSAIGTVCVIDSVPRAWTDEQERQLARLARVAEDYLEGLAPRRAWQHSPVAFVVADREGRCVRANPAFERFVGVPVSGLLQRPLTSFLQPRDRNVLTAMISRALKTRESPTRRELGYLRLSGELVSGGTSVSPLVEPDDQVVVIIRDISLERRLVARSGVVAEVRAELAGPLEEADRHLSALESYAETHAPDELGRVASLRARLAELDAVLDARIGDIAARAQVETELRASEQRLQALVNRALGAMLVIDDRGRIVDANPMALERLGYVYEDLIGAPLARVHTTFTGVDCERWFREATARTRALVHDHEAEHHVVAVTLTARDGASFSAELELVAMDWNGPGRLVLVVRDTSEAVARERALLRERDDLESEVARTTEALREVQRMEALMARSLEEKDTLLKEIHHRVKNNLQMVSSLLSLQLDQMPEGRPQELLEESVARVRSMALIHQHLYGSPSLARVDLGSYARSLTESLRYVLAPDARVAVEADLVEVPVEVAVPVGLVLNELLTNALKYGASADGHSVRIVLRAARGEARLEVRDGGKGLPEGFDLRGAGTLGMQLVTTLTRQLRGTIVARSEGGAVFEVAWPL